MNKFIQRSGGKPPAIADRQKQPVAPPVYRPTPTPHVLQRKEVLKQQSLRCQSKPAAAMPHVHRPQPTPKVLQTKTAINRQPASSEMRQRHVAPPARPPAPQKIARPQIATPQTLRTQHAVQTQLRAAKLPPSAKTGQSRDPIRQNNSRSVIQRYKYEKEFTAYMEYLTTDQNEKNAKIFRRLKAAQEAVVYTQNKLVFGPGNVIDAIEESKGRNMSAVRVAREGESGGYFWESDIKRSAIAARRAQGGNCDEHGQVAYYQLVHKADPQDYAYLCANGWHVFAILADPPDSKFGRVFSSFGEFDTSTAVVADAWLGPAYAVKFDHWRFKDTKFTIHQSSACYGGARKGNLLKDMRAEDISLKTERTKKKHTMRQQVEGSADELYKKPKTENMYPRWEVVTSQVSLRLLGMGEEKTRVSSSTRPNLDWLGEETPEMVSIFGPRITTPSTITDDRH